TLTGGYLRLLPAPGLELALTDSEFSPGFAPSESQWLLPDLEPLAEAKRTFIFQVEGQPGEKRALDIEAGVRQGGEDFTQRELMHVVTVSATEVIIEQLYNGSTEPLTVRPGETVSGEIRYHNTGSVGLKDVIVKVVFEGSSFDAASLTLSGAGSYDPVTKSISWSAATVPELGVVQPQQAGSLKYSFKILPLESLPATSDESQVLVTMATVDSPNLPAPVGQPRRIISDRAVLSLGTNLILEAAALYDDGRLGITSTGPRPPRVGETTTYTVRWRVGSTLNDVSDIQLVAVLPDGVRYTGQKYVTSGEVTVNDRTGEVGWRLPLMAGQTGRTLPHQELHVQVAITPGEDKRGEAVTLLNKVTLTAVDEFVDEAVEASLTQFPTTETASPGRGTVQ
ncbi:MAG TPA: hypothetical protein VJC05_03480, partial [Candidatus Andersenbacteria bacterium]|nr:hypothetical protein [Candidatus Andersenbacteria bacterium]